MTLWISAILTVWFILLSTPIFPQQDPPAKAMSRGEIEKNRQEWFYRQRAYPAEHIPAGARLKALEELSRMLRDQGEMRATRTAEESFTQRRLNSPPVPGQWVPIGPQPAGFWDSPSVGGSSGRATALAVDPGNPDIVYLGTAGGGVWKTINGGQTWVPLTDTQPSLAIGSLALDPSNPNVIYAGTGEENSSADSYYGAGILKSTDGGATWQALANSTPPGHGAIGSIAVHPTNSSIILQAGSWGVLRTADGAATWTTVIQGTGMAVVFDPTNGNNSFAALGAPFGDSGNGVYSSTNAGQTWTKVLGSGTSVLPSTPLGRIGLALDPTNPQTLYAAIANPAGSPQGDELGVFRTTDGGKTWTQLTNPPECCTWYENSIAVDPANPKVIYTGSGNISRSLDGGTTWTDLNQTGPNGIGMHPDQHGFAFSADGTVLYVANDGGAWSTTDVNVTSFPNWNDLNATIATINFYPGLSSSPSNLNLAFGGTQDEGSLSYTGNPAWNWAGVCGDGSYTAVDSASPANVYLVCAGSGAPINKSAANGSYGTFVSTNNGFDATDGEPWVASLVLDPSHQTTLYFAGNHYVYQSVDAAGSWTKISPSLTGGITTIAVAPTDSNTVYVGTGDGHVHLTTNAAAGAGATWADVTAGLPKRGVSRIAVDPGKATTAYALVTGFSGHSNPSAHVFKTTNGGGTWTDISSNLPDTPVNAIVVDFGQTTTLYLATDIGVFYTPDGGAAWYPLVNGLPNVVVQDLKLHPSTRTLRASTHGRGAWDLALPAPLVPAASLSPSQLSFNPQIVNATGSSQTITLTNTGNAPMALTTISVSSQFAATNNCTATLAPAANCTVTVSFTPTSGGAQSGTLTINDDAPGSPQTLALTGMGQDFSLSTASGSSSSSTITAGQTASYKLSVGSAGGFNQLVSIACTGAPTLSSCSASPASLTLNGTSASATTVTVTTTGRSGIGGRPGPPVNPWVWLWMWGLLAAMGMKWMGRHRLARRNMWLTLAVALLGLLLLTSCGGGGGGGGGGGSNPFTTAGTYSLTVTGTYTSGTTTDQHNITLTLTVN